MLNTSLPTIISANVESELNYLRHQNKELSLQLERINRSMAHLQKNVDLTAINSTTKALRNPSSVTDAIEYQYSNDPTLQPIERKLKRKSSDVDPSLFKSLDNDQDSNENLNGPLLEKSLECSFEMDSTFTASRRSRISTRLPNDADGNYSKGMSTQNPDEEEGLSPELIAFDEDETNSLVDDDSSHNKHEHSSSKQGTVKTFVSFRQQIKERAGWLIGLLVLQSCSSFIIKNNQSFLQNHMVIVQFLTMLVGAGGNAGNQASVRVIRGLAVGTLNDRTMKPFLIQEVKMACGLSVLLGLAGFIRAALFRTSLGETIAVTTSLCAIVAISVGIGSTLPLGMKKVGIDPAHSSTTVQVLMDILGVLITVSISSVVLGFKVFTQEGSIKRGDSG